MNQAHLAAWFKALKTRIREAQVAPDSPAYQSWQRKFLLKRLKFSLQLAVFAYLTFILLRLVVGALNPADWDASWIVMACFVELGLLTCLILHRTPIGRRHPEWIFLGCSWSITLIEQVWATWRGVAFLGLFAWTLTFLTQATLMPVRWRLHMLSQLGVMGYFFGTKTLLGLEMSDQPYWDESLWLYMFWFCCICDLSVFFYEQLQRSEFHAHRELEAEQEKSERLLLNILPEAVARQLKQEHRTIAENFAEVTVLFADIVDFTRLSADIPAHDVVNLLNQIFSEFDHLVEKHGLEKIKTIGDSYMVVGGLPLVRADHIDAIADMALDMLKAIAHFNDQQNHEPLNVRIGINTGPVVAGVIGVKKFIYDLWGDTVNTASRMESQGLSGCIQVTETVYERLKHKYRFEERGTIPIKGKGEMRVYLLSGKQEAISRIPTFP